MFGFGASKEPEPAAPTREQRAQCWANRDVYFACLDKNGVVTPGDPAKADELGDSAKKCEAERATYEGSCGRSWVSLYRGGSDEGVRCTVCRCTGLQCTGLQCAGLRGLAKLVVLVPAPGCLLHATPAATRVRDPAHLAPGSRHM
jgi:cytochrome c oxidase assembly factor 6